ncbi:MAG: hypothetical protein AB1304_07760 [Bacteroidota bacterium]
MFWVNTAHENKKNWQYTATYAEEGKKKEVISYFDGSLRDRQSVTKINTDNNIIVGESFYDFQGRKAVTVLPVPVMATVNTGAGITGTVSPLKYYEKFNVNMSGQPFSAYDFDMDGSGSNTCIVTGAEMDTVSGASRYYSNNNPLLTLDQSYLPHARKYPYTQVEYTSDNTGRIRRQSGVGKYFQLYSGHETQFLYGMPNQIQLNRMFGDEAGEASRYRMQVTIDANGQTSITYMNLEGKTVATSLAGAPPMDGNQLRLDSLKYANENQALLTVDFFNKNSFGQSNLNTIPPSNDRVEFFQQLLVPFRSNYHIDYNFTIDTMGISCPSSTVCFHCVYNLDMYITTECGDTLFKVDSILGYFVKTQDSIRFITRCDTGISFNFQKDTDIVLEAGVYSVSKVLRIHPDALNFYLSKYLDKNFNPCIKTYDDFYNDIWNNMDTTGCDSSDCKQCLNELGSMSNFLAQHPDKDSLAWHILYEDCINQCKTKTECDINFEIMLADVSPGGQYGKYDYTTHSASAYPLSVFNESNLLRANNWANNADMIGNWRHPKIRINYQFYDGYFDETGTRVKVYVNLNPITGQYSPPILSSVTPTLDPVMGQEYVYPEHLKNLVDFMQRWNSFFARSLVVYHPEYAYYLSCQEQSIQFSGEKHSSDAFDVYLKDTVKTFQDAVNEGIIKNNYLSTTVSSFNKMNNFWNNSSNTPHDPMFSNSVYVYSSSSSVPVSGLRTMINMNGTASYNVNLSSEIQNKVLNYFNVGSVYYSMMDVAAAMVRCPTQYSAAPTAGCFAFGTDFYSSLVPNYNIKNDSIRNKEWEVFKNLYLSEKRKIQYRRMDFFARYALEPRLWSKTNSLSPLKPVGGCNICIGSGGNYNIWINNMMVPFPFQPYFNPSQPCGGSGFPWLYYNMKKRFLPPGSGPIPLSSVSNYLYHQTGQCPLAFQLQHFLNALVSQSVIAGSGAVNLANVPEFSPDLYAAVNGSITPAGYISYVWQVSSNTGQVLVADIKEAVTQSVACTFTIDVTGTGISNLSNILSISQLNYDGVSSVANSFTALATYWTGSSVQSAYIKGSSSCIDVKNCQFQQICTANQLASDFQNFMNGLINLGLNTSMVSISSNTLLSVLYTGVMHNSLSSSSNTANIVVKYQSSGGKRQTLIYDNTNLNRMMVFTYTVVPNSQFSSIVVWDNIQSFNNNYFQAEGKNSSGVKVADIYGNAIIKDGGDTILLSMGQCTDILPIECQTVAHKNLAEMQHLIEEIFAKDSYTSSVNLFQSGYWTGNLQNYLTVSTTSTSSTYTYYSGSGSYDSLLIQMGNDPDSACYIQLYHYDGQKVWNFSDVLQLGVLHGYGAKNLDNSYNYFYIPVSCNTAGGVVQDTIYGVSCIPIQNCDSCSQSAAVGSTVGVSAGARRYQDSVAVAGGKAYYDFLPISYQRYAMAVDSLSTHGIGDVQKADIVQFSDMGMNYSGAYIRYLSEYDSLIDNKGSAVLGVNAYVLRYGNRSNCAAEYLRYKDAVIVYNRMAVTKGADTLVALADTVFYMNLLCDSAYRYVDYLLGRVQDSAVGAIGVLDYFGKTGTIAFVDSCSYYYIQYVRRYKQAVGDTMYSAVFLARDATMLSGMVPLYSYTDVYANGLCADTTGIRMFRTYINAINRWQEMAMLPMNIIRDTSNSSGLGGGKVFNQDSLMSADCQVNYYFFIDKIKAYNDSIKKYLPQADTLDPMIYPSFQVFQMAGYCMCDFVGNGINIYDASQSGLDNCFCIRKYLSYIDSLILVVSSGTVSASSYTGAVDIDHYGGCDHFANPVDKCDSLYQLYVAEVQQYNNLFAMNCPAPAACVPDSSKWIITYDKTTFKQKYCLCAEKFISDLQSIIDGYIHPDSLQLLVMTDIGSACIQPCGGSMDSLGIVAQVDSHYVDPCKEMLKNVAQQNALNAYQQYVDSIASVFSAQYRWHCLKDLQENFTYSYTDKEYHYTLYYYDAAGNLIKTVPPEGVELLNIHSYTDPLYQQISFNRDHHLHNVLTAHRVGSFYVYNSLNQLVEQKVPDHDAIDTCWAVNGQGLDTSLVITSVQFLAGGKGYLCGYLNTGGNFIKRGVMYATADSGQHWVRIYDVPWGMFKKVYFPTAMVGYAASDKGLLFKSTDGGMSWDILTSLYHAANTSNKGYLNVVYDLYFENANTGIVVGIKEGGGIGGVFRTADGGGSFTDLNPPNSVIATGDTVMSVHYDSGTGIYFMGIKHDLEGKIVSYNPSGSVWKLYTDNVANHVYGAVLQDNHHATVYGEDGTVLTADGNIGGSVANFRWKMRRTGIGSSVKGAMFDVNGLNGVMIDGNGVLYSTGNGGRSWAVLTAGVFNGLKQFISPGNVHKALVYGNGVLGIVDFVGGVHYTAVSLPGSGPNLQGANIAVADVRDFGSGVLAAALVYYNNVVGVNSNIAFCDNILGGGVWQVFDATNNANITSALAVSDADFRNIHLLTGGAVGNITPHVVLTNSNGKIYYFIRGFIPSFSVYFLYNAPVSVPAGASFVNVTSVSQNTNAAMYTYDRNNNRLCRIMVGGSPISVSIAHIGPAVALGSVIKGVSDRMSNNNYLLLAGDNGVLWKVRVIGNNIVDNADLSNKVDLLPVMDVRSSGNGKMVAVGMSGQLWQTTNITNTGAGWRLYNTGTGADLNAVHINLSFSPTQALAAGRGGSFVYLLNVNSPGLLGFPYVISGVGDVNDVVISSGVGNIAYYVTEGGQVGQISSWYSTTPGSGIIGGGLPSLYGITENGGNIFIGGSNNKILMYNGTVLSDLHTQIYTRGLKKLHFYDLANGMVIDSADVIRYTHNGGMSWQVLLPEGGAKRPINSVGMYNVQEGYVVGNNRYVAMASVMTGTLIKVPNSVFPAGIGGGIDFYDIHFNVNKRAGIVGSQRSMLLMDVLPTVSFTNVTNVSIPVNRVFYSAYMFNNGQMLAGGSRGALYLYNGTGVVPQMNYTTMISSYINPVTQNLIWFDIDFRNDFEGYVSGNYGMAMKLEVPYAVVNYSLSNVQPWMLVCDELHGLYNGSVSKKKLSYYTVGAFEMNGVFYGGSNGNAVLSSGSQTYTPGLWGRMVWDVRGQYTSRYWYDKVGRLILSQNSHQYFKKNPVKDSVRGSWTYTLYDALGRIVETGEKFENYLVGDLRFGDIFGSFVNGYMNMRTIDDSKYYAWLYGSGLRQEVVHYYYDEQKFLTSAIVQKNLRNRIASVTYEKKWDGSDTSYLYGSHYSYDIHGNVQEIWQEQRDIPVKRERIKHIEYEYDLISGKVNKVFYQKDSVDMWVQGYRYDSDNRIIEVSTSRDGIEYTMEGKYYYYPHGPLMRIEYGQHQVQGLDYAYTIQGWLKAINGTNGGSKPDMGKDGYSGYHSLFSKDALGVVLNYYEGDYDAVDYVMWNSANSRYISYEQGSSWKQWRRNMYNGNISGMSSSIGYPDTMMNGVLVGIRYAPLGNGYYYDQLNRLVQMRSFNNIDTVNNEWKSGGVVIGDLYRQRFEYDRNGNIEMQVRCDSIGNKIDSLVYHYERNGGKKQRNRLMHVNDKVGVTVIGDDIEDEGQYDSLNMNNNNYIYDRIGNLIMDKKEQLEIRWNLQNKVQYVKKQHTGNTYTEIFFEYDAMGNRVSKSIVQHTVSGSIDNSTTARTYYVRDAQGNVLAVYEQKLQGNTMSIKQAETHIYGTQRLGISYPSIEMIGNSGLHTDSTKYYYGHKDYELTNHLGNVLATVSDRKIPVDKDNDAIIDNYVADITSVSDYYPFGSKMYGRRWEPVKPLYRFGFNTQEKVNEISPDHYTAKFWEYDARLGRRWNLDPKPQVGVSDYAVNEDNPIRTSDPQGDCPICPLFADAAVDIAFAVYDLAEMGYDYITKGKIDPASYVAFGADVASIAIPFSTGAGLAARQMYKALGHTVEHGALKGITKVLDANRVEKLVIREGKPGAGVVVIGESMERVRAVASKVKGETFDAAKYIAEKKGISIEEATKIVDDEIKKFNKGAKAEETLIYKYNKMWIEEAKKEGKTIVDIGIDPKKPKRSSNYKMEVESTKNYGNKVREFDIKK